MTETFDESNPCESCGSAANVLPWGIYKTQLCDACRESAEQQCDEDERIANLPNRQPEPGS